MSDLKLNTVTGDIDLVQGKITLLQTKSEGVRQRLQIRLNTALKEWFLDRNIGIPYFETILVKGTEKAIIDSIFRSAILETRGVRKITSYTSVQDRQTRKFSLSFTVLTTEGEEIDIEEFEV